MKHKSGHRSVGSKRRALLIAAATLPAIVRTDALFGQSGPEPVSIGWLTLFSREVAAQRFVAFRDELASLRWKIGSQVTIEERYADGRRDRLKPLAEELAAKKPAIIVAVPAAAALVVTQVAPGIAVVAAGVDLVAVGLAQSLARPGGMVTGISTLRNDLAEKYLELLAAAIPNLKRVGFLADPNSPVYRQSIDAMQRSSARYGVEARLADAVKPGEIEPAIARLAKGGAQALIVLPSAAFLGERQRIVKHALANRWPVVTGEIEMVHEGALLGYGAIATNNYRRLAYYVDRILKGAKPGDLPIEQPTKFELVVNMKTARALGITIPQTILVRADRVIE